MNISLIAVDFLYHDMTKYMVERAAAKLNPKEIVIVSDKDFLAGSTYVHSKPVKNMHEYATFLLKNMWPLIDTSHCLYMQWDSNIRDMEQWTDEFLKYDYIGAPWPWHSLPYNIGNGGFSIRSKRLLDACASRSIAMEDDEIEEDVIIGKKHRFDLESRYGIKFPPLEIAQQFSIEKDNDRRSFGYHGVWNIFKYEDDATVEFFLPRIDYRRWNKFHCSHSIEELLRRGNSNFLLTVLQQIKSQNPAVAKEINI